MTTPQPTKMTMNNEDTRPSEKLDAANRPSYEAPAIEEIMTPSELEREVHYAGFPTGPNNP